MRDTFCETSNGIIFLYCNSYYVANQETDLRNIIVAKNIPYGNIDVLIKERGKINEKYYTKFKKSYL